MFGIFKSLFGKPVDYRKLMAEGAVIVDVRTPSEYKSGHIPGALNIPLDSIKSKSGDLKSKNKVVITCCRSGARSAAAIAELEKRFGFDNLYNLKGGIMAYSKEIDTALKVS